VRSLLTALSRWFVSPRPAYAAPPSPGCLPRPTRPPAETVLVDGAPLVRPCLVAWEREMRLQRERRRAAVRATLGHDRVPREVAA
jgi:hypothetical protein